jgi:hypothetical protein
MTAKQIQLTTDVAGYVSTKNHTLTSCNPLDYTTFYPDGSRTPKVPEESTELVQGW